MQTWLVHVLVLAGCCALFAAGSAAARATELVLKETRTAGTANGEVLVIPDCAGSALKIKPCQRVARSWLAHFNSRAQVFVDAYRAAGYQDPVSSVTLDCSLGIYNPRKSRLGVRKSRHAYAEACDGNSVWVNDVHFPYRAAVTQPGPVRHFYVSLLDAWGETGPGCIPEKGYTMMGIQLDCRPIPFDNCGVIDWRERGANSQYGHSYHLSYCYYTDPERAYE